MQTERVTVKRKIADLDGTDRRILVYQHLGLGDHFICFGLICEISKLTVDLYLVCKQRNLASLTRLYAHLSNIYLVATPQSKSYEEERENAVKIACNINASLFIVGHSTEVKAISFDKDFYTISGVHESKRYSATPPIELFANCAAGSGQPFFPRYPKLLIHREASYGVLPISITETNCDLIEVNSSLGDNILVWLELAKEASEIHCIPSSFFCMIDLFSQQLNAKLYLHDIRLDFIINPNNQFNCNRWNVISYDKKL